MKRSSLVLALLVFLSGCQPKAPLIQSISPQIGEMGEPVVIRGVNFGDERNDSYVTIAGILPTSSAYIGWQDSRITLRIPEFGEAGLIYVHVNGRKSNGILFTNQATLPQKAKGVQVGPEPRITQITPQSGAVGNLISIMGTGFGISRGNGGVFFTWNAQTTAPVGAKAQEFIEVSEADFGYELWTDREIQVRVPDGAAAGNMEVRTPRGNSPSMFFDPAGRSGTKTFHDKRSYTINCSVDIKINEAEKANTMYLWIPRPAASAAQRNIELFSGSAEPFIDKYRGASLFKLDNLEAKSDVRINLSWKVDVYGIAVTALPQSIRQESDSSMRIANTQNSLELPSDDPRIRTQARAIVSGDRNPYSIARKIYDWMLTGFTWDTQTDGDIFTALETKEIDSYLAALLYCTLLRSEGVPCLPVAGVLIDRNRQTMHHYWAEFWVDGLGWIPVDPAMGASAPETIPFNTNPNRTYFGNVDSQRIAFSRGFSVLSSMDPRGRTVTRGRSYSLQNLWEEAIGIDHYTSLWGDIIITGMYVQ
jgi:hypothetical protein